MAQSPADVLRSMSDRDRVEILSKLSPAELIALRHCWRMWARSSQLTPGTVGAALDRSDWSYWLLLAGRGFGKTRCGAEFAISKARELPGSHGAIVASTADDARKVMLSSGLEHSEGASGILAVSPPDFKPIYEPSKRTLTWPNGSVATTYSAEEPDRLRGPQSHWGWADEIAAWQHNAEAWDQFLFGLRLGTNPQACITTTPRPIPILRKLLADKRTVVTRGSTFDNKANLAPSFFSEIIGRYEGTRLGRQELYAELLEDVPGALWNRGMIDALRVSAAPQLLRVVVAIDPAVSSTESSDETGIVVCGIGHCPCNGNNELHGFVIEDGSGKHTPNGWAKLAVEMYKRHRADRIVAEVNNGGDLVEINVRTVDHHAAYKAVHAAQGKRTRAEPIAALYEQGRVHHVGSFAKLEDQLTTWEPLASKSPDRLDAMVWGLTELMLGVRIHVGEAAYWPADVGKPGRTDAEYGAQREPERFEPAKPGAGKLYFPL